MSGAGVVKSCSCPPKLVILNVTEGGVRDLLYLPFNIGAERRSARASPLTHQERFYDDAAGVLSERKQGEQSTRLGADRREVVGS